MQRSKPPDRWWALAYADPVSLCCSRCAPVATAHVPPRSKYALVQLHRLEWAWSYEKSRWVRQLLSGVHKSSHFFGIRCEFVLFCWGIRADSDCDVLCSCAEFQGLVF